MEATETCASCAVDRPIRDLLVVTDRRTGSRWFVCRPGLTDRSSPSGLCFRRAVPTADRASIALADPGTP